MKKLYLEITHKCRVGVKPEIQIVELQSDPNYLSWGITAVGCVFTSIEGEYMIIHPKSVTMMKQYWKEV